MKIVKGYPPNYAEIKERLNPGPRTVFAYGDTIYSPSTATLPPDLIAHESVHFRQQQHAGGPEAWWCRYLDEPQFRLEQEVEAYRAQFALCANLSRAMRRKFLAHICAALSSPMYGRLVTKEQAKLLVARGAA